MTAEHHQSDDPAVYLVLPPTPEEHILAEQVDLHGGAAVPFWMFSKVAHRLKRQAAWIGQMDGLFRRVRRYTIAGLTALAMNLTAVGGYALHRASQNGASEERAMNLERATQQQRDAVEREIQDLRLDIRELRAAMRKVTGEVPKDDISYASAMPPSLTLRPEIEPAFSCADVSCFASIDCRDPFTNCHYCYQGHCSSVLPAEPEPSPTTDAGVDAPDKGTSL